MANKQQHFLWIQIHRKWRSLPAHIRKGLLRLYIAVSALWTLYFGREVVAGLDAHPYGPVWRYVSGPFWTMLIAPVGGPILFFIAIWVFEGFRNPQPQIGNLRDRIATDILFRPDVAAYEYLATGSLFGKRSPRLRLPEENLSAEQKASLPDDFYGPDGVDADEMAKLFGYTSGQAMIERLALLFSKWGDVDRNQMLNKIVDEELDRRMRRASAARR